MSCRRPEMHPSVEATLCDWLQNHDDDLFAVQFTWSMVNDLYGEFRHKYYVEEWGISVDEFGGFLKDVISHKRCSKCGTKEFPYFIQGDKECIRCV